jgi:hypothetical protein
MVELGRQSEPLVGVAWRHTLMMEAEIIQALLASYDKV